MGSMAQEGRLSAFSDEIVRARENRNEKIARTEKRNAWLALARHSPPQSPAHDRGTLHTAGPWGIRMGNFRARMGDHNQQCREYHRQRQYRDRTGRAVGAGNAKMPAEANARLIAASPDLLEALRQCQRVLNDLTRGVEISSSAVYTPRNRGRGKGPRRDCQKPRERGMSQPLRVLDLFRHRRFALGSSEQRCEPSRSVDRSVLPARTLKAMA